jgi:hypothetical protein
MCERPTGRQRKIESSLMLITDLATNGRPFQNYLLDGQLMPSKITGTALYSNVFRRKTAQ